MDQSALDLLLAATEAAEMAEGVDNSTRITSTDTRGLAQTPDLPPTTHYTMLTGSSDRLLQTKLASTYSQNISRIFPHETHTVS